MAACMCSRTVNNGGTSTPRLSTAAHMHSLEQFCVRSSWNTGLGEPAALKMWMFQLKRHCGRYQMLHPQRTPSPSVACVSCAKRKQLDEHAHTW